MAAATSSPELFINLVGTFVTEGDLGVGTIVGSAVFNVLAVPSCCGLFAGTVGISLSPAPSAGYLLKLPFRYPGGDAGLVAGDPGLRLLRAHRSHPHLRFRRRYHQLVRSARPSIALLSVPSR